jgi:hypothetical protein
MRFMVTSWKVGPKIRPGRKFKKNFFLKWPYRGNFIRGFDCAHSRTLKMLPWPWFREWIGVLKRKSNISGFLWENRRFLGFSRRGIDCAHCQIVKMLPWPWFKNGVGVLKRKSNIFGILWKNRRFLGFSRRGIDCAHSRSMKTLPWPCFWDCKCFL